MGDRLMHVLAHASGHTLGQNSVETLLILAAMAYASSTTIYASPGRHRLQAHFVAVGHGLFSPPVTAPVTFRVVP
jgi:hypothetical protein